jgi:hypothetical protein
MASDNDFRALADRESLGTTDKKVKFSHMKSKYDRMLKKPKNLAIFWKKISKIRKKSKISNSTDL